MGWLSKLCFLISLIITITSCSYNKNSNIETIVFNRDNQSLDVVNKKGKYLNQVPSSWSGINFKNQVNETNSFNHTRYKQIYNGAGVAIGDLNADGLVDIYFGGNSVDDRLYFNKGNFQFEDVTVISKISSYADGWTYGVNFVDVNNDGWLDIYVCKAGDGQANSTLKNKLFINNHDGTFKESANEYGIASNSYSVQSSFFDYDLDGDLDLYLLNHPSPRQDQNKPKSLRQYVNTIESGQLYTDQFYENINGKYVLKTKEAGLLNYGFKNAIAVGDFNQDGYPDLYVSTDYIDPDLFYKNNGDGTFSNTINEEFKHITYYSMGSDATDINNDGLLDLYVTDMTPSDHIRSKQYMASMDTDKFHAFVEAGFNRQYMVNTLQLNNGNNTFSEVGQLAGIAKTDWSWAPLFMDIDLDGNKDLFITNGIDENVNDNDLNRNIKSKQLQKQRSLSLKEFLETVPTETIPNQLFQNKGKLAFSDTSESWVDNLSYNSNGAAYADLDNDGDLDLVVNNMEAEASVYENSSNSGNAGNMIGFSLKGDINNPFAIGTKIKIPLLDQTIYYEHYPSKGYLSSNDYNPIIGVGEKEQIDRIEIIWPDNTITVLDTIEVNKRIHLNYNSLKRVPYRLNTKSSKLTRIDQHQLGINFRHKEDVIDDFKKQLLLPYSQSQNGPFMSIADVNNDGQEDLFIGGAAGQKSQLYIQNKDKKFTNDTSEIWLEDGVYEDQGSLFFDADNDGDKDLYVTSGGAAFDENNDLYIDRFYENDGKGQFVRKHNKIPIIRTSTQVVKASDIDGDGDLDLFIGGRVIPDKYPYTPDSYLLLNEDGIFKDVTNSYAPGLRKSGLVTNALFTDFDSDGDEDVIITGEWTEIQFFTNENGRFTPYSIEGVQDTMGIWFSSAAIDLDNDGDEDYIFGNLGINSKFASRSKKEFHVFCDDFDNNGTYDIYFSKDYKGNLVPMRGRECSSQQMPFILDKFETYESFANATISEVIGQDKLNKALHYSVKDFSSMAIINKGNGEFEKVPLPVEAQFSPIMNFAYFDINNDGKNEIIAVGNLYPAEVETTRYDASIGTILSYENGDFQVIPNADLGFYTNYDVRDIEIIKNLGETDVILIANNNEELQVFSLE